MIYVDMQVRWQRRIPPRNSFSPNCTTYVTETQNRIFQSAMVYIVLMLSVCFQSCRMAHQQNGLFPQPLLKAFSVLIFHILLKDVCNGNSCIDKYCCCFFVIFEAHILIIYIWPWNVPSLRSMFNKSKQHWQDTEQLFSFCQQRYLNRIGIQYYTSTYTVLWHQQ